MNTPSEARITGLFRYPVKGLSPERLDQADLVAGETLAFDRAWAIENGPGRFDADAPKPLPKVNFLMLMRNERLAALKTVFDPESLSLAVLRDGKQVCKGTLDTRIGRQMIEQFFAAYLKDELLGPPHIVHAPGHSFSDVGEKCVHIVNEASLRDLERLTATPIDPLRFRANVYVDGIAPWEEFEWVGKEITLGGARLQIIDRTSRCEAVNVDPETGNRDLALPPVIERAFGHRDLGVYAKVVQDGTIREGSALTLTA